MTLHSILVFVFLNIFVTNIFVKSDENIVKTTSGSVKGLSIQVLDKKIDQFLGIPYAVPPLGSLRFAKPKPITKPIEGIIDSTKPRYSCIQAPQASVGNLPLSEDCLNLNIWSPKREDNNSTKLKPVMFWIYGGGLIAGSIFQERYNGSVLATHDIVFVSVNYRLGYFGFLFGDEESAPGNVGFYDQLLGLKWVRENIHLFGGDKNQITIFGESSGSLSVSAQVLSPLSKGLFKKAILQSGAHLFNKERPPITKSEALIMSKQMAKQLNCSDDKQWLQCLRGIDSKKFIPIPPNIGFPIEGTEFLPYSTQKAFNENKFNKDLDILSGVTKDEGTVLALVSMPQIFTRNNTKEDFLNLAKSFDSKLHNIDVQKVVNFYLNNNDLNDHGAIKQKSLDLIADFQIKCPTYLFAKRYAEHSVPETNVFFYELTHKARDVIPSLDLGIYHGAELDFVFGLLLFDKNTNKENIEFTKEVQKLWTNFAKYGKPDSNWPKLIDTKTHSSIKLIKELNPKTPNKYFTNLFEKTCDGFWKNYF